MPPPENPITKHRALALSIIFLLIILLAGFVVWEHRSSPYLAKFLGTNSSQTPSNALPIATATYTCDDGKTIQASYYDSGASQTPAPGQPPVPTGSVALVLSDGRSLTLPQTISGSGVRYANSDESFVFWNKGNTAFVEEGVNQNQTYTNCVTGQLPSDADASSTPDEVSTSTLQ